LPGHASVGARHRQRPAPDTLQSPGAWDPAEGQWLAGSVARILADRALHGRGDVDCSALLSQNTGLTGGAAMPAHMPARQLTAIALSLLSACAVGPDFHHPNAPLPDGYTAAAQPQVTASAEGTAGAAQRFVSGASIPSRWWESFDCA